MSRKVQKISVLMVIIVFLVVGMRANTLLANYPIVPDLTIESTQEEGRKNESFQLKIVDANTLDTKVWFPLPANVSFTGSQNEHGSVTYDAENHQLVIDWNNQEEENRFVTIELLASEAGSYEFQASVMREEETVASQPVVINVEEDTDIPQEEEVEVPVENEQPEVVEEEPQEESNVETQQARENVENPIVENEQAEKAVDAAFDPRIGLPIKDIFPDSNLAEAVAEILKKSVNDPVTNQDVNSMSSGYYKDFSHKNISDVTGITVFSLLTNFNFSNNNITEIPNELVEFIDDIERLELRAIFNFGYNKIEKIPERFICSFGTYLFSHNKLKTLPKFRANFYKNPIDGIDVSYNQLTSIDEDIFDDFGENPIFTFNLSGNQLTNLPPILFDMRTNLTTAKENLILDDNLLPEDGEQVIRDIAQPYVTLDYGQQKQLKFDSEPIINEITKASDIEPNFLIEKLRPYLKINNESLLNDFPINSLVFLNKNGEGIDINTYFEDDKSIKNEVVYAKVQSRTPGVFDIDQNTNSITSNQAPLTFKRFGSLSFVQAPSQLLFGEDLKITATDQVLPLQSFDRPLSIQDDKIEKSTWRMTAKMTKELTSPSNSVLENSLHYRLNGEDSILNKTELNIYTQQNSNDEPFNISDKWVRDEQNGLFLEIKAGQALAEEYSGIIEWKLQDVPIN